ncbi:MAG: hypothetical protein FD176_168 [Rhodospirillaceae bacterium]|nr:MAG: hypothetical protein FD176_168 [Rhodospirillaceae bacterium]TNC98686.1 MAG: hypothetical protein FD119_157 [Stygiobacter sp.]
MTYPEVFQRDGIRYSIDPALNWWRATWITADGWEVERSLWLKVRPGDLTDDEEREVVAAFNARYGSVED